MISFFVFFYWEKKIQEEEEAALSSSVLIKQCSPPPMEGTDVFAKDRQKTMRCGFQVMPRAFLSRQVSSAFSNSSSEKTGSTHGCSRSLQGTKRKPFNVPSFVAFLIKAKTSIELASWSLARNSFIRVAMGRREVMDRRGRGINTLGLMSSLTGLNGEKQCKTHGSSCLVSSRSSCTKRTQL